VTGVQTCALPISLLIRILNNRNSAGISSFICLKKRIDI
jgi:hypothetical protein